MKKLLVFLALFYCSTGFTQRPDSSNFYFQKGIAEKNAKRYLVATKYFDKAISFDSKNVNAYLENAYAYNEMHRTDFALTNFTKVFELDPKNMVAINELMNIYYRYRNFNKTVEFAHLCTNCPDTKKILALSYFQQQDYASAERALLPLTVSNPNDAEIFYSLGRTYLELEQEKKAVVYYQKAIALDSTKNTWYHELGLLNFALNDYKNAVINFNKAVEKGFPASNEFNENLGFAYIYSGEFEKGETVLNTILAKKPNNRDILQGIAQAYYDKKMYDKCLDYCQKLLEANPKDANALYQAGMCFQKKGQKDKGQAMCDKAIEMDPSLSKMKHQMQMGGAGL